MEKTAWIAEKLRFVLEPMNPIKKVNKNLIFTILTMLSLALAASASILRTLCLCLNWNCSTKPQFVWSCYPRNSHRQLPKSGISHLIWYASSWNRFTVIFRLNVEVWLSQLMLNGSWQPFFAQSIWIRQYPWSLKHAVNCKCQTVSCWVTKN